MSLRHVRDSHGFSLIEVLVTLAIGGLIVAALAGMMSRSLGAAAVTRAHNDQTRQARFAMQRMVAAVTTTTRLLVPLPENAVTPHSESLRDPGILALALDPGVDRDDDGFADADNDRDGRVDEDWGKDMTNDGESGLIGIDDDGDGAIDEGGTDDDDEDGTNDEDPWNGIDDDSDGAVDEDGHEDANGDSAPGVAGEDDDGDTLVDEGADPDDDEDGAENEDWVDAVAYFQAGSTLIERLPMPHATSGTLYVESVIAEGVKQFRVERLPQAGGRAVLLDLTLLLADPTSTEPGVSLHTRVRVGGGP